MADAIRTRQLPGPGSRLPCLDLAGLTAHASRAAPAQAKVRCAAALGALCVASVLWSAGNALIWVCIIHTSRLRASYVKRHASCVTVLFESQHLESSQHYVLKDVLRS